MKILIATHQDKSIIQNNVFKPIQVNSLLTKNRIEQNYILDSIGKHISEKNESYSELTALYWLWKNSKDDVVGIMHYRRFFNILQRTLIKPHRSIICNRDNIKVIKLREEEEKIKKRITSLLTKNDVILPYPRYYKVNKKPSSLADQYNRDHRSKDWDICMDVIKESYPEYLNSVDKYLYNSNIIYGRNMFISKTIWLNNYCKWLFDILFEVEKRITLSTDPYQKRVFGFLSERLLTLYVRHHNFKIKHVQLLFVDPEA